MMCEARVLIRAHEMATHQRVIDVFNTLAEVEITSVTISDLVAGE